MKLRLEHLSLPLLLILWQAGSMLVASPLFPPPITVAQLIWSLTLNGHLLPDFAQTLSRAVVAFGAAMICGAALGLVLGRSSLMDKLIGPWVTVGMNLPAIVIAVICYIWLGLTEGALILAVVINKTPMVAATFREGVRALSPDYDELAKAFRMPALRRLTLIHAPQLLPFAFVAARTGLALIWKMVLVFEVLGSDGGVGFRIGLFFQYFDITGILAYTCVFVAIVMMVEGSLLKPLERRFSW